MKEKELGIIRVNRSGFTTIDHYGSYGGTERGRSTSIDRKCPVPPEGTLVIYSERKITPKNGEPFTVYNIEKAILPSEILQYCQPITTLNCLLKNKERREVGKLLEKGDYGSYCHNSIIIDNRTLLTSKAKVTVWKTSENKHIFELNDLSDDIELDYQFSSWSAKYNSKNTSYYKEQPDWIYEFYTSLGHANIHYRSGVGIEKIESVLVKELINQQNMIDYILPMLEELSKYFYVKGLWAMNDNQLICWDEDCKYFIQLVITDISVKYSLFVKEWSTYYSSKSEFFPQCISDLDSLIKEIINSKVECKYPWYDITFDVMVENEGDSTITLYEKDLKTTYQFTGKVILSEFTERSLLLPNVKLVGRESGSLNVYYKNKYINSYHRCDSLRGYRIEDEDPIIQEFFNLLAETPDRFYKELMW